jgi:glycosyltransferase involved in cell wall biosynthesis
MTSSRKKFVLYSQYAFLWSNYAVFELLCRDFGLQGFIITHERTPVPKVYAPSGYLDHTTAGLKELPEFITVIPKNLPAKEQSALLKKKVYDIRPDYIWAQEEPNNFLVNEMLRWFYRQRTPRIVVAVVENLWPLPGGYRARLTRFRRRRLWKRFDAALACATKSAEAIRPYGMPNSVPLSIGWVANVSPFEFTPNGNAFSLPQKQKAEFVVGFAGSITHRKGWRVLLAAMSELPERFKCLIAGAGEEEAELRLWCQLPTFLSRVHYLGVVEKNQLWNFYPRLDVFVLPSLTSPHWTEQFGSVLAEAMACGIPVIGSTSGAIPEVVANCGIVVEENNPTALAQAIQTLESDPELSARYSKAGLKRFEEEYSYQAYASKIARALGLETDQYGS